MRDWIQKQLYRVPPWFVWTVLAICTVVGVYDLWTGRSILYNAWVWPGIIVVLGLTYLAVRVFVRPTKTD